jgi:hypothetical protein
MQSCLLNTFMNPASFQNFRYIIIYVVHVSGYALAQLVAALRYKSSGRCFESDGAIGICH